MMESQITGRTGFILALVRRPGTMPHVLVNEEPGSSLIRASPVRNAFGGQVMGSLTLSIEYALLDSGLRVRTVFRLVQRELVASAVELVAAILQPIRPRDQRLTPARGAHLVGLVSVDKLPAAGGV
jgi:hypothetical protein